MKREPAPCDRRTFLKTAGWGMVGAGLAGSPLWSGAGRPRIEAAANPAARPAVGAASRVALVKGRDRREIIFQSLKLIEDDVWAAVDRKKRVLIKPNMAVDKNPLAITHVDAVRAVLEFLKPRCTKPITVAESGVLNTAAGFKANGYEALVKEFGVSLVDLNASPSWKPYYVFTKDQAPQPIRVYADFVDPNVCLISLARMKTHDTVLVTLSLKNVLMAAPVNDYKKSDKGFLHGAEKSLNDIMHFNLFHMAHRVWPDLAVIDGFESMEGHGPAWGTPLDTRLALASRDPLAADIVGTKIMGFDSSRILYLRTMAEAGLGAGDVEKIPILGTPLESCLFKFKAGPKMTEIYHLT
ncbi:MAG: DUF362 domain-containing protein [Candidatus Aminicenantes bacterium]|nr:DUF362 domain-containing protein [Candidatus Aminicenantes bacterium]